MRYEISCQGTLAAITSNERGLNNPARLLLLRFVLKEFSLSVIANHFELAFRSKAANAVVSKSPSFHQSHWSVF